jgi:hypothetical protein
MGMAKSKSLTDEDKAIRTFGRAIVDLKHSSPGLSVRNSKYQAHLDGFRLVARSKAPRRLKFAKR